MATKKMNCGGSAKKAKRYDEGGVAEGANKNIGDDVRARAMAAMAAKDSEASSTPAAAPKVVSKPAPKLAKPDYSNEDLDKMGIDDGSGKINKARALKDAKDVVSGSGMFSKFKSPGAALASYEQAGPKRSELKAAVPAKKTFKASTDEGDAYKKGGKVAGRLATRGYGIAKGGKK